MTDVAVDPGTWVPRLGDSEIPEPHAELIRGLYGLAAWLADHPEVPTPHVQAYVSPGFEGWAAGCRMVDRIAEALGVAPEFKAGGDHYVAKSTFGPVEVSTAAITPERMARFEAEWSYGGHVTPDDDGTGDV